MWISFLLLHFQEENINLLLKLQSQTCEIVIQLVNEILVIYKKNAMRVGTYFGGFRSKELL